MSGESREDDGGENQAIDTPLVGGDNSSIAEQAQITGSYVALPSASGSNNKWPPLMECADL